MQALLIWVGRLAGTAGAALSIAAVLARAANQYYLAGVSAGAVLQLGTSAMVLGCLAYLAATAERAQR